MFHSRPDATLATDIGSMRRIMPYVSPRRNDSAFYLPQEIEVEAALEFLEKRNAQRPAERPITLFHLLLRATSQAVELRPGVNRFVKGGRLWQRDGVYLSFSAKRALVDGARMITIKRRFAPERETLDEMVDAIYEKLLPARKGALSTSDKETRLMSRLPGFLTRTVIRAVDALDTLGLLPRSLIEPDPLFTSVFAANLGSVGHDAGFHHLWERGTCSIFCVMGRIRRDPNGRRVMTVCWTYDERIEDGLYSYIGIAGIQERIENPEQLLATTGELAARAGARADGQEDTDAPF
jgi:hypothetical protein